MYRADTLRTHNSRYSWVGRIVSERYVYMWKHEIVIQFLISNVLVDWIHVAQDGVRRWALVNTVLNIRVP